MHNLQDYARQLRQGRRPSPFVVALLARKRELGMNRRMLARLSGVGEKTLIDWEHGAHPGIDNVAAVAQVLNMHLALIPRGK